MCGIESCYIDGKLEEDTHTRYLYITGKNFLTNRSFAENHCSEQFHSATISTASLRSQLKITQSSRAPGYIKETVLVVTVSRPQVITL